jgi:membrane protein DedA with SNARE-associated domain
MHLERILIQYGLLAVLLLATVEGDLTLILAGVVAHLGMFSLGPAILAGALGNLVGDSAWYLLGRSSARVIREGRFYRRVGPTVERLAKRLGVWQLLAARVVYGTRNASMVFWGLHGLRFDRFILVDAVGCLLWCSIFGGLGFLLSNSAEWLIGEVKHIEYWLLGAVVVAAIAVFIVNRLARRELGADS